VQQVAALPFVPTGNAIDVLLITSRRRKRWILPKGWPAKNLSLPDSAAKEASEEAGVLGPIQTDAVGSYSYSKKTKPGYPVPCQVFIYPLLVMQHTLAWREQSQRSLKWFSLSDAVSRVDDDGVSEVLGELAATDGACLHAFVTQAMIGSTPGNPTPA